MFSTCIFNIIPAAKESAKEMATKNKADSDDDDDDNESRKGNEILNLFKLWYLKTINACSTF